jgi:hypothetical protein
MAIQGLETQLLIVVLRCKNSNSTTKADGNQNKGVHDFLRYLTKSAAELIHGSANFRTIPNPTVATSAPEDPKI